jgi:hypothetical protein
MAARTQRRLCQKGSKECAAMNLLECVLLHARIPPSAAGVAARVQNSKQRAETVAA